MPIKVTIAIRPVTETRTFSAGLDIIGDSGEFAYGIPIDRVLLTIGGSTADLDRLSGATMVATLDVTGLRAGVHQVPVTANLPTGTTLVAAESGDGRGRRSPRSRHSRLRRHRAGADRHVPPVRHRRHPRRRQRRPQADARLRPRPGGGPPAGRSRRSDRRRPGHAPVGRHVRCRARCRARRASGVDVHVVGRRADASARVPRRRGPFAAGIMVSASHNPADDNGLKVLDADGLKLDDSIEDELEALIWRTEELGGATNDDLGRMVDASGRLARLPRAPARPRRDHRRAPPARGPRLRQRLGLRRRPGDPGRDRRATVERHQRLAGRHQHQRPFRRHRTGARSPRRSSRPVRMPASRSMATPTGSSRSTPTAGSSTATRSWASSPSTGWPRNALPGRRSRRVGPLERRAPVGRRGGRRPGRPNTRRRQVHPRGDAGRRGPSSAARRAATSSCSSTRRRATASSPPSRSCGSWSARTAPLAELAATDPAAATATASGEGSSQGPVGRRPGPPARHRGRSAAAGRHGARPGPAVRHGARAAGDGRGGGRGARLRAGRLARDTRRGATTTSPRCPLRRSHAERRT